ncbi:MAG TPA: hypothetical protein VHF22_11145, partial [Planctomycetota bacterium]|nr:hypothetical protein [Planctomycetota bacterium]
APIDPWGYVTVSGAKTLAPGQPFGAAYYDWSHRPLVADSTGEIVREQQWLDLVGAYGITSLGKTGGLEAGLDLPVEAHEVDFATGDRRESGGLGDLRTDLKASFGDRDDDFFGLETRGYVSWPTGRHSLHFMSNDGAFTIGGEVGAEAKAGFIRGGITAGFEWIDSKFDLPGTPFRVDDRFRFGLAIGLAPLHDIAGFETLEAVFELTHWTLADRPWDHEATAPVEVGGALRYNGKFFALAGASGTLNQGIGAPDARIVLAVGYAF